MTFITSMLGRFLPRRPCIRHLSTRAEIQESDAFSRIPRIVPTATRSLHGHIPGGLLVVYKPKFVTSNDVTNVLRGILKPYDSSDSKRVKIGHGGTLDPLAEGVLVLGIKSGCAFLQGFLSGGKSYSATGLLGCETDTLDSQGSFLEPVNCGHITAEHLREALQKYKGEIMQVPPAYSALKRNGVASYALARRGEAVELNARPVTVHNIELVDPVDRLPEFKLDVACGGGCYVRSLITDIARDCNGAAHMTGLVRTVQGPFTLDDALPVEKWTFAEIRTAIYRNSEKAGIKVVEPNELDSNASTGGQKKMYRYHDRNNNSGRLKVSTTSTRSSCNGNKRTPPTASKRREMPREGEL